MVVQISIFQCNLVTVSDCFLLALGFLENYQRSISLPSFSYFIPENSASRVLQKGCHAPDIKQSARDRHPSWNNGNSQLGSIIGIYLFRFWTCFYNCMVDPSVLRSFIYRAIIGVYIRTVQSASPDTEMNSILHSGSDMTSELHSTFYLTLHNLTIQQLPNLSQHFPSNPTHSTQTMPKSCTFAMCFSRVSNLVRIYTVIFTDAT